MYTAAVGKLIFWQCRTSVKYHDTSFRQLKEIGEISDRWERVNRSYSSSNILQNQIKSVNSQCIERCDMKHLFLSTHRTHRMCMWNRIKFGSNQYQSVSIIIKQSTAIGNRRQSIKSYTDLLPRLVLDYQYQLINWYRLVFIGTTCHRLDNLGGKTWAWSWSSVMAFKYCFTIRCVAGFGREISNVEWIVVRWLHNNARIWPTMESTVLKSRRFGHSRPFVTLDEEPRYRQPSLCTCIGHRTWKS